MKAFGLLVTLGSCGIALCGCSRQTEGLPSDRTLVGSAVSAPTLPGIEAGTASETLDGSTAADIQAYLDQTYYSDAGG